MPAATEGDVTVLLFASAREAAGEARATFPCAGGTVADLAGQLSERYGPALERALTACAVWVNGAPARSGTVLATGDEVAVMPPVSGG